MSAFGITKVAGTIAEDVIAGIFYEAGWMVQKRQHFARRDLAIMLPHAIELLEVKNESNYANSGKIAIEMLQGHDRRPSGISLSESTVCIHYLGEMCVLYRTQPMRIWLKQTNQSPRPFFKSDNCNEGVLVSIAALIDQTWADHRKTVTLPTSHLFAA